MDPEKPLASILAHQHAAQAGSCPEIELLADYLADRLSEDRESRIRQHLVGCPTCAEKVLDLEALSPLEPEVTSSFEEARAWRQLRARRDDGRTSEAERSALRSTPPPRTAWLTAAAAILVAGLASWWAITLRSEVAGLRAPQENFPIVYLDDRARTRTGAEEERRLGASQRFLLVVTPEELDRESYRLEIEDSRGAVVYAGDDLVLSDEGTLRVVLPRRIFSGSDGGHRVRVVDGDGAALGDYRLSLPFSGD